MLNIRGENLRKIASERTEICLARKNAKFQDFYNTLIINYLLYIVFRLIFPCLAIKPISHSEMGSFGCR